MIIFTGTGRSGTGFYAKLFDAPHEYNAKQLLTLYDEYIPDIKNPITDPFADLSKRISFMKTFLQDVNLAVFRDSNNSYIHFLDALHEIEPDVKIVLGVRDGRDFARSGITRSYFDETHYGIWSMIPEQDDPYYSKWPDMSPIERMAWMWNFRNQKALTRLQSVPDNQWMIVRLEDVAAITQQPNPHIEAMEDFLGLKANTEWMKVQYNKSEFYSCPPKEQWTLHMNDTFDQIAGDMMRRFNYEMPV